MDRFIVKKTNELCGKVDISGSKNAVLPIMAASLLVEGKCKLFNVPLLTDVQVMGNLLKKFGVDVSLGSCMEICSDNAVNTEADNEDVKSIRASFLIAGGLLGRYGRARLSLPGGCSIGVRPVDLHLKGFSCLGADYALEHGIVDIKAEKLIGSDIYLDFPSVGATENIILAAVKAEGITRISNCAAEPEINGLIDFLCCCGAKISWVGTDTIEIKGVDALYGCDYSIMPDRIEAGTYMLAAAAVGGRVQINNIITDHLRPVISKLREINAVVEEFDNYVIISSDGKIKNTHIKTMPYPGFPTDMQAQFMSIMTTGDGTGIVNETVFENRFMYVGELNRMGADIKIEGRSAVVRGVERLTGTKVRATDLRAGAALIISALCAEGMTEIGDIHYIDRGYEKIDEKLRAIGGNIERIKY